MFQKGQCHLTILRKLSWPTLAYMYKGDLKFISFFYMATFFFLPYLLKRSIPNNSDSSDQQNRLKTSITVLSALRVKWVKHKHKHFTMADSYSVSVWWMICILSYNYIITSYWNDALIIPMNELNASCYRLIYHLNIFTLTNFMKLLISGRPTLFTSIQKHSFCSAVHLWR